VVLFGLARAEVEPVGAADSIKRWASPWASDNKPSGVGSVVLQLQS
jgi:hypothetical protein